MTLRRQPVPVGISFSSMKARLEAGFPFPTYRQHAATKQPISSHKLLIVW